MYLMTLLIKCFHVLVFRKVVDFMFLIYHVLVKECTVQHNSLDNFL